MDTSQGVKTPSIPEVIVRQSLVFLLIRVTGVFGLFSLIYALELYMKAPTKGFLVGVLPYLPTTTRVVEWIVVIYVIMSWYYRFYKISTEKVTFNQGIIKISRKINALSNIEHIELQQGVMGRLFSHGNLVLKGQMLEKPILLKGIYKPWKVHKHLEGLLPKLRS